MSSEKKYDVYGLGNALVDIEFKVDEKFLEDKGIEKGLMTLVDDETQRHIMEEFNSNGGGNMACGGSAANTIIAVSCFGGRAFYSCKVGEDELGDFYLLDLKSAGVDTNNNDHGDDGETGKCLVMVTPDADRTMNTYLGITGDLSENELDFESIKQSEYVYIEGYLVTNDNARKAAVKVREFAKENDVKVALTFSDPAMVKYFKDGMKEMVGDGVDLLFCNKDEAFEWTGAENLEDALVEIKKIAKEFVVTLGSEGSLIYNGEDFIKIKPNMVDALDTTGAGDLYAGAFLYGITNGLGYEKAGELASLGSSEVVAKYGPRLANERYAELAKGFEA